MFIVHKEALSSKKLDKNELLSAQAKISIGLDTRVAGILQWGVENDNTFDHTLYTGADQKVLVG